MKKYKFSFFIALFFTTNIYAAEWYAGAVSSNIMIFVDKSTLQRKGDIVRFWQWQFFTPPIGKIDSAKSKVSINCIEKKRKTDYLIAISGTSAIEKEGKIDSNYEYITPNSIEAGITDLVCKNNFQGKSEQNLDLNQVRDFMYNVTK